MIGTLALLAAASGIQEAPRLMRGDLALVDCQAKKSFMSYPVPSTPSFVGNERWVFHIKGWGITDAGKALWEVTDADGRTYSNPLSVLTSVNGDKLDLMLPYSTMGMANIGLTSARQGTAVLSATEQMRHGDGEYQVSGECTTFVKRAPKGSVR